MGVTTKEQNMVASMTAYARQCGEGIWAQTVWELRSVNHRFLEVSIRLPEALRGLETAARERVARAVQRGKLDCTLRHDPNALANAKLGINRDLARALADACKEIGEFLPVSAPISPLEILRWPGVVETQSLDLDEIGNQLLGLLDRALNALVETRNREGDKLKALIEDRCIVASQRVEQLRQQVPSILAKLKERLLERLTDLGSNLDPGRVEQEMLLVAQKLDVAEELDRLDAHLSEVRRLLNESGPNGRRLDFLMQELNREANTIASKSNHIDSTGASVELKVLIEQMREQIQNIE
jgi:uncharacterized protein (TIGR00255 family)